MSTRVASRRSSVLPTLVVAFIVATAGIVYLNSRDDGGHTPGDRRGDEVISLFVDFSRVPRRTAGVHVIAHAGERHLVNDLLYAAPRTWVVVVPRGEQVTLSAIQTEEGELRCALFRGDVRLVVKPDTPVQIGPPGRRLDPGSVRCYHNRV